MHIEEGTLLKSDNGCVFLVDGRGDLIYRCVIRVRKQIPSQTLRCGDFVSFDSSLQECRKSLSGELETHRVVTDFGDYVSAELNSEHPELVDEVLSGLSEIRIDQ